MVAAAADAAAVALDKTTEQLDVLAEAGVVDAGGRGLLVLLDAMSTTLTGHAPHRARVCAVAAATTEPPPTAVRAPQFEVMYLLSGCDAGGVETLRERLDELGESVAIAAATSDGGGPLLGARARRRCRRRRRGGTCRSARPSRIQITALSRRRGRTCPGRLEPRAGGAGRRRR